MHHMLETNNLWSINMKGTAENWISVTVYEHGVTTHGKWYKTASTYWNPSDLPTSISGGFTDTEGDAIMFDIKPDGDLFEMQFSLDGGKTWEIVGLDEEAYALLPEEIRKGVRFPPPEDGWRPWSKMP